MRRGLFLVVALVLLTGCAPREAAVPPETGTPAPTPTASPGVEVQTDWSRLEPRREEGVTPLYTRWYGEYREDLTADPGYGPLLPFAGARYPGRMLSFSGEPCPEDDGLWDGLTVTKLGLVTRRGEVVVDPVYDYVGLADHGEEDGEPIWDGNFPQVLMLCKLAESEEDAGWRYRYAAAALDGSWATPMAYDDYRGLDRDHLFLTNETEGVMLRSDGQELFLVQGGEEAWFRYFEWLDGLMFCPRDGRLYDGETGAVLPGGPFCQVEAFSEGLAPAQEAEDGLWGYIDRTGAWVIRPTFLSERRWGFGRPFREGRALVKLPDGKDVLIDRSGRPVLNGGVGRLKAFQDGTFRWYLNYVPINGEEIVQVLGAYDAAGAALPLPAPGETLRMDHGLNRPEGGGALLYWAGQAYRLPLPCSSAIVYGRYARLYDQETGLRALVTLDGEIVLDYDPNLDFVEFRTLDGGDYEEGEDAGEPVLAIRYRSPDYHTEYLYQGEPYAFPEKTPREDTLTYVEEDWGSGYQDSGGQWVFRWPYLVLEDVE